MFSPLYVIFKGSQKKLLPRNHCEGVFCRVASHDGLHARTNNLVMKKNYITNLKTSNNKNLNITNKNLLTVLAMIIFIPTAKFLIDYFMIPWKSFVRPEEYTEVEKICEPLPVYAELVITASEKRYSISYLLVDKDDNIVAYTTDGKADKEGFKKGVTNFLNYYNFDSKVELYSDYEAYISRCKEISALNLELTDKDDEHIALVLSKISIMSI